MKSVWTLLTCLVLALCQAWPVVAAGPAAPSAQPCKHCNCGGTGCCVDESPSAPQPSPGVPPASSSHLEELTLAASSLPPSAPPATDALTPPVSVRSLSFPSRTALHVRNCCFLI